MVATEIESFVEQLADLGVIAPSVELVVLYDGPAALDALYLLLAL